MGEPLWSERDFDPEFTDPERVEHPAGAGSVGFRIGWAVRRDPKAQPYERQAGDPLTRPLRIFALDEAASRLDGREATLQVPYEPLAPGPRGALFEVDARCGEDEYRVVDLEEPRILLRQGVDPSPSDPRFHQQMVYAVASLVYDHFRRALGRDPDWAFPWQGEDSPRLVLRPYPAEERNAYYLRESGEIRFGYFPAGAEPRGRNMPGAWVYTAISHDVVAHEVAHALLDGLRPLYQVPTRPDVLAFHEAFADLVAIFLRFSYPEVVKSAIAQSRGDIGKAALLTALGAQFGQAALRASALRVAVDDACQGRQRVYDETASEHELGSVLVRAVFAAFHTIFRRKTARLVRLATGGSGVLAEGQLPADLRDALSTEASKLASQFLNILIRAIDYCPPVDLSLGEFLRALITADGDTVPDDPWAYREALIDAFVERRIYPDSVRSVSEDALRWQPPAEPLPPIEPLRFGDLYLGSDPGRPADVRELCRQATVLGKFVSHPHHLRIFGLEPPGERFGPPTIESIRSLRRVGPDGQVVFDVVASVVQEVTCDLGGASFRLYCGSTVFIDPKGRIRYAVYSRAPQAPKPGEDPGASERYLAGRGRAMWQPERAGARRLVEAAGGIRRLHGLNGEANGDRH